MILQNWMVYVFMVIFVIAIQWAVSRVRGEPFHLVKALSLSGYACIGLTLYYLCLLYTSPSPRDS